jgi:putative endonuclease
MLRDWLNRCWAWLGLESAEPLARQDPLGARGEKAAARFLKRRGYKIVARGVRSRLGELDLVAVQDRTVVFVEVKTRTGTDAGQPLDAVTPEKQRRLTQAALAFLKYRGLLEERSRFDVVSVVWPADAREPRIEHIVNAFEAVGRGQMWR